MVYTWGQDYTGALGNSGGFGCDGDNNDDCYTAEPLNITNKFDGNVVSVDSGTAGELGIGMWAYAERGGVYVWGPARQSMGLISNSPRDNGFATPTKVPIDNGDTFLGRSDFSDSATFLYGTHSIYDLSNPDKGTENHDVSSQLKSGESITDAVDNLLLTNQGNVYQIVNLDNTEMRLKRVATNTKVKELISPS